MKKFLIILTAVMVAVFAAGCGKTEVNETGEGNIAEESSNAESPAFEGEPLDNSTYRNVMDNYYKAYERDDAAYQMAAFAPSYREYVINEYGYTDEEEMAAQLQTIVDEVYQEYVGYVGEGFVIVYDVVDEQVLSDSERQELQAEMEAQYGGDFSMSEAVTAQVSMVLSGNSEAGSGEQTMTFGKFGDGNWYLLI